MAILPPPPTDQMIRRSNGNGTVGTINRKNINQKQTKLLFLLSIIVCIANNVLQNHIIMPTIAKREQQDNAPQRKKQQQLEQDQEQQHEHIPLCLLPNNTKRVIKCRIDEIGQFLESSQQSSSFKSSIFHEPVQSMPSNRRIPIDMANNDTYIKRAHSDFPDDRKNMNAYFNSSVVEFNPVIVPLYTVKRHKRDGQHVEELVSDLDSKLLYDITGGNDDVYYILYQRSSNNHACGGTTNNHIGFGGNKSIHYNLTDKDWGRVNYITFMLLDKSLQPIESSSVIIDFQRYFFGVDRNGNPNKKRNRLYDFTFFAARTTPSNPKKDHFFLLSNGSYLLPISIKRRTSTSSTSSKSTSSSKINLLPLSDSIIGGSDSSSGLEIRIIEGKLNGNVKEGFQNAMVASKDSAKNLHIFESAAGSSGNAYTEYWPMLKPERSVQRINLFSNDFTKFQNLNLHGIFSYNDTSNSSTRTRSSSSNNPVIKSQRPSKSIPTSQSASYDISYKGRLRSIKSRGTACCIDMVLTLPTTITKNMKATMNTTINNTNTTTTTTTKSEQQQQNNQVLHVKIGISHSVSQSKRHYLHQLYAFDPKDEHNGFPIIAYSGFFCLSGLQKDNDTGRYDKHWITHRDGYDESQIIDENNIVYACPQITFATGIAEYLGNDSTVVAVHNDTDSDNDEDEYYDDDDDNNINNDGHVIVSYGVDDCYSRSIIVSKRNIEWLLLGSQYQGYRI